MKKIIVIILMIVVAISSMFIFDNTDTKASIDYSKKKKITYNETKDEYSYVTTDSDNIEELLKEEEKIVTKVNYAFEEKEPIVKEEKTLKNGFIEENNNTYYYENDIKAIGQREIDNGVYYFDENGIMQKDKVIENCYYDQDGKLYIGFKEIDGNKLYFTKEGISKGITEIDGKKYYFDDDGHLLTNCFYDNYYLDEEGVIVTGQREIGGRIYIFNDDGIIQNGFQTIDGNVYFLGENNNKLKGLQIIDGIRYYFDFETGILIKKDVKSVIDISSWQGDLDFDKLKESNLVDGVIVRLGYGTTLNDNPVLDNKFKRNIKELKRLDIPYGIYFYGYAQNEYASNLEANFVNNVLKEVDAKLSFPIFYDAELTEFDGVKYTKTLYRKVINNFVSKLNEYGYKDVGLYGNLNMLTNGSLSFSKKYPVWVAQYFNKCEYDKEYIGWQYTSNGSIPGINGRVDMNIFY